MILSKVDNLDDKNIIYTYLSEPGSQCKCGCNVFRYSADTDSGEIFLECFNCNARVYKVADKKHARKLLDSGIWIALGSDDPIAAATEEISNVLLKHHLKATNNLTVTDEEGNSGTIEVSQETVAP